MSREYANIYTEQLSGFVKMSAPARVGACATSAKLVMVRITCYKSNSPRRGAVSRALRAMHCRQAIACNRREAGADIFTKCPDGCCSELP